MGEENVFQELQAGKVEARKKWLQRHGKTYATLAVQYGLHPQDAEETVVLSFAKSFRQLSTLADEDALNFLIIKNILQEVMTYALAQEYPFKFEEDRSFHQSITSLPRDEKIAFILHRFHALSLDEIAAIVEQPVEEVKQSYEGAVSKLANENLAVYIGFLQKSYGRMDFHFNEEMLDQDAENESLEKPKQAIQYGKKHILLVLVASLAIVSLIIYSIFTSDAYQEKVTAKWIEQLKKTHETEKESFYDELGIDELRYDERHLLEMKNLFSSNQVDMLFEDFIKEIERDFAEGESIDRKEKQAQFDEYLDVFATPKQLSEDFFNNPSSDDFEVSEQFLRSYLPLHRIMSSIYYDMVMEEMYQMEEYRAYSNDFINLEEFMKSLSTLPVDLESLLAKMHRQYLYLSLVEDEEITQEKQAYFAKMNQALHPELSGFVLALEGFSQMYFLVSDNFDTKFQRGELIEIEETLIKSTLALEEKEHLIIYYVWSLFNILGEDHHRYEGGVISQEKRKQWLELSESNKESIAANLIQKIMDEFEASDWRISETLTFLEGGSIYNMIYQVIEKGSHVVDWEELMEESFHSVTTTDTGYQNIVNEVYTSFQRGESAEAIHHLTMAGVLFQALERQDDDMLARILDVSIDENERKVLQDEWKKNTRNFDTSDYIHYSNLEKVVYFTTNHNNSGEIQFAEDNSKKIMAVRFDNTQ